jgi:LysR family cyn operon transcriptional activator
MINTNAIDLRHLRSFLVLSRSTSYAQAAARLHISQPALSKQMAELAAGLGVTLFERAGRRSVLTETGRGFAGSLAVALDQLDQTLMTWSISESQVAGGMRIAATHTYLSVLAMPAGESMLRRHPDLRLEIQEMSAHDILARLHAGDIDMGLLPRMEFGRGLTAQRLFSESFGLIGHTSLIGTSLEPTDLKRVAGVPLALLNRGFLMRQQIDRQALEDGVELHVRAEVSSAHSLVGLLRRGTLASVGSALMALDARGLCVRPIRGRHMGRDAMLCWRSTRTPTRAMRVLREEIRDCAVRLSQRAKPGLIQI